MIMFVLGTLLGILDGGGAVCVRYLRQEIAADIGPATAVHTGQSR